jgi:F0F1-type ATP synthase membrane subunit b/b'
MKRLLFLVVLGAGLCVAQEPGEKSEAKEEAKQEQDLGIWRWANFVLLAGGLGFLIMKSVPSLLRSRTGDIQQGISEAQKIKAEADARYAEMEQRLARIGADIEAFRVKAKAEMEQEASRIQNETAAHAKKLEAQAAAEIESAGKLARAKLKEFAADLALNLAATRVKEQLDASSSAGLVDNFITDLKREVSKN